MSAGGGEPGAHAERPAGRTAAGDAVLVLGAFMVAGVAVGLLWPQLADPVVVTRNELGVSTDEVALANRFDADGWYSVLGGCAGLVLGLALMVRRRSDELVTLLLIVAGAFLASWVSAALGSWVGPGDPNVLLADAEVGATATDRLRVTSGAAYLVWPITAVIGALLVLWSPPGQRLTHLRDRAPARDRT